jgi:hypothetical protein
MKLCPFCSTEPKLARARGALNEIIYTVACRNDQCLAVGPIGTSEAEAERKWNERNLNLKKGVK